MTEIAAEETEHAELALDVDAWCRTRVDGAALDAARDAAVAKLGREIPPAEAGMFEVLRASLWLAQSDAREVGDRSRHRVIAR